MFVHMFMLNASFSLKINHIFSHKSSISLVEETNETEDLQENLTKSKHLSNITFLRQSARGDKFTFFILLLK